MDSITRGTFEAESLEDDSQYYDMTSLAVVQFWHAVVFHIHCFFVLNFVSKATVLEKSGYTFRQIILCRDHYGSRKIKCNLFNFNK